MPELDHPTYMNMAIELACQNLKRPFGTVIIDSATGELAAEGINKAYTNPVLHSDMAALHALAAQYSDLDWGRYTLYTTAEPNPMCMSAILWARLGCVVYGTSRETLAELGFRHIHISAREVVDQAVDLRCKLIPGIMKTECDALFTAAAKLEKL